MKSRIRFMKGLAAAYLFLCCVPLTYANPVGRPKPGTAEYCRWEFDRCTNNAALSFAACFVTGGSITPVENYCILQNLFPPAAVHHFNTVDEYDSFVAQGFYAVAECIAALDANDTTATLNFSSDQYMRCQADWFDSKMRCRWAFEKCRLSDSAGGCIGDGCNVPVVPRLMGIDP